MKTLNYIMAAGFGIMATACALGALLDGRCEFGCLAIILYILAWVAWGDYKQSCKDDL